MSWLTIQMWLELLIAGAFGALIGWALHAMRADVGDQASVALSAADLPDGADPELRLRMVELETQLRQEKDENATLRARVSTAPVQAPPGDTGQPAEDDGQLSFRNRHLESRVRFLEGKIADLESEAATPRPDDETDEATRLRWRNRYLEGRVKYLEEELVRKIPDLAEVDASTAMSLVGKGVDANVEKTQPPVLAEPKGGQADDLKIIGGIGPKLEKKLNELGIWHFDQIAAWTPAEIEWVNQAISFRGRIERENWVSQAAQLAQGVMPTEARPG
jgi:predicted flap endonuclease-1-like 5' DNA nuclease